MEAESADGLLVSGRAGTEGGGDFDGCAAFAAFSEGDGVGAGFVGQRLARGAFRGVERGGGGAFPRLRAELSIGDAGLRDELHQVQREPVLWEPSENAETERSARAPA